jgi:quinol monooxygenase YgiN
MVLVHARVSIKPEARERWFSMVEVVVKVTRTEDACRTYRVYEDIQVPNSFIFVEEWQDLDGLYRHFRAPHFRQFFDALPEVLAGPPDAAVIDVASTVTLNDALAAAGASALQAV